MTKAVKKLCNTKNIVIRLFQKNLKLSNYIRMIKLSLLETIRNGSGKPYMIYATSKKENLYFHIN